MSDYTAPVEDMDFVLRHIVDLAGLSAFEQFSHVDVDETRGILDEAGRFFAEVVAPTNRAGDVTGSQWQSDGSVKTPDEFGPAYENDRDRTSGDAHLRKHGAVAVPAAHPGRGAPARSAWL